jgi:hypothetical protein
MLATGLRVAPESDPADEADIPTDRALIMYVRCVPPKLISTVV